MLFFLAVGLVIGGLSVVFVLQNITPITVTFFTWQISGSLSVLLLVALLTGMLLSVLVLLPSFVRAQWQLRALRKQNKKLSESFDTTAAPTPSSVSEPMAVPTEVAIDLNEESK